MTSARPLSFALFARLELPEFSALARKATESVTISLDSSLLELAGRFLDASDPQDAAAKEFSRGCRESTSRSCTSWRVSLASLNSTSICRRRRGQAPQK